MKLKPGDEVLIRAKLINVRESDNEATVGFDSTTTAVVPPWAVCEVQRPPAVGAREELARRITCYLSSGGLFNPERTLHERVRDLLIECRDALFAASDDAKLWRISQAVKLQRQNDLAGLQQFYDYVKGVVEDESD